MGKRGNRKQRSTRKRSDSDQESADRSRRRSSNRNADSDTKYASGTAFSPPTPDHLPLRQTPLAEEGVTQRDLNIQRAMDGTGTSQEEVPEVVLDAVGSGGMPLDNSVRQSLEDRMGADFSDVRIHTGAKAAEAADAIDAKAFTCGNSIVFNSGEYDPQSAEGQFLLAHELAHVKQQNGGAPLSMMPRDNADLEIDPDPQLERDADQTAKEALSGGEPLTVNRMGSEVHVQRLPKGKMFEALALFESQDDAGEFRSTQNDRQYEFLLDEIATYAEASGRLAEVDSMREFQEIATDVDADDADFTQKGKEYLDKELPSKSEIDQAKQNIEDSLQESLDQIALTDEQRDRIEDGISSNFWTDVGASTGATILATLLTSSAVGGAAASIGFGVLYAYADNHWEGLSGDLDDRAQELVEIIEDDAWRSDQGTDPYSGGD